MTKHRRGFVPRTKKRIEFNALAGPVKTVLRTDGAEPSKSRKLKLGKQK
jgi:hypothetical protein